MAGRVGSGSLKTGSVAVYAQQPVVYVQQPAVLTVFDSLSLAASRKPERGVLLAAGTGTVRGEAGAGAMSSPAAVLRTGYMRRAQALRLMRRHSPRARARPDQGVIQ